MFRRLLPLSSLALALMPSVQATRQYVISNNCPLGINLYINGESRGTIANKAQTTFDFADGFSGFIYSDFNRGNVDGAGTVRAGFFGPNGYYYIVHDPKWLNVGVGITPLNVTPARSFPFLSKLTLTDVVDIQSGGFCVPVTCEVDNCTDSFAQPPTRIPPPVSGVPPSVPLYQCPQPSTGYKVEFCPAGTIPNYQTGPNTIQPIKSKDKCLDVRGGILADGTPVQIYDCNGTAAQKWVIKRGGQQIKLSGTNFCLDAGSSPANGVGMKIWTCYDNLAAQQWTYSPEDQIRLTNQGQCLDLTDGDLTNGRQAQTWECDSSNQNQIWTI